MGSKTRAKFECVAITKRKGWSAPLVYEASLQAVTGDSVENADFFAATPSGTIKLDTIRDDYFEVGKFYYVDFILADA